ncbi:GntR family transcriptional regulator [Humitalea sp. 24SJ18S-53]|uniref:GntR family transcriptional regulator n=1 Tax=Humitalea sp. 24SJ18S-53 TaxID=3422307 RepID=UPI003D67EA7D
MTAEAPSLPNRPDPSSPLRKSQENAAPQDKGSTVKAPSQVSTLARRPAPKRRTRATEALGIDIARRIEQLITEGTLRAGERLNEATLARSLGVSRGPVREAARALEKIGLVTVIMNRGAFVRSLDLDEAMEVYEINGVLFGLASGHAAIAVTAQQALTLRGMVEAMDAAIARDDRDEFFAVNSDFHAAIMTYGRNREAQALYDQFTRKLRLLRRRSFEASGNMQAANREHRDLMEAILAGDGVRARDLAEAHARLGRARFLDAIGHASEADNKTRKEPS